MSEEVLQQSESGALTFESPAFLANGKPGFSELKPGLDHGPSLRTPSHSA